MFIVLMTLQEVGYLSTCCEMERLMYTIVRIMLAKQVFIPSKAFSTCTTQLCAITGVPYHKKTKYQEKSR